MAIVSEGTIEVHWEVYSVNHAGKKVYDVYVSTGLESPNYFKSIEDAEYWIRQNVSQ